jgi:chaperonin cofactor prefoldin
MKITLIVKKPYRDSKNRVYRRLGSTFILTDKEEALKKLKFGNVDLLEIKRDENT